MDFLPSELLPPRSCVEAAVPSTFPRISGKPSMPETCSSFPPWNHFGSATPSSVTSLPRKRDWGVYAKPPFAGPEQVLKYVARYTHRVAISNNRLLDINDGKVAFRWKDYRDDNQHKTMTLVAEEFFRRFLLHVLPEGFQRIRYYGFLANRYRAEKLALCRQLLQIPPPGRSRSPKDYRDRYEALTGVSLKTCPLCRCGTMVVIEVFERPQVVHQSWIPHDRRLELTIIR